jgi:hypothetical protein
VSRRRRARGRSRDGLFSWRPDGEIAIGEVLVNPLTVACDWPPCRAPIGERCSTLKPHPSRVDKARAAGTHQPPPEPA